MSGKSTILQEQEFGVAYFEAIQKKIPQAELNFHSDLEMEISLNDDIQIKQFLGNAYSEYQNSPEELTEILDKYSDAVVDYLNQDDSISIENIIPAIRDANYFQESIKLNPNFEEEVLFEQINDELFAFYVINSSNTIKFLYKSDFESLDISIDELREKSLENLVNLEGIQRNGDDGLYQLIFDGNFESSLILLDIWSSDNFDVRGEIVLGIPARDVLLVTGSEDMENLARMREIIANVFQSGDHIITDSLFVYRDGALQVFR